MRYTFKDVFGARFPGVNPQKVGDEISDLISEMDSIRTQDLVDWAWQHQRSESHKCFEWDDERAAESHRRAQARNLLNALHIERKTRKGKRRVHAFAPIKGRGYMNIEKIMQDPVLREEVVTKAMKEAQNWSRRYEGIQEFAKVHSAIEVTRKAIHRKRKAS
jgi:hypothetical protein